MDEGVNNSFLSNLKYILDNLEKDKKEVNNLEDKKYLELSKTEVITYINCVYEEIKLWEDYFKAKKYENIIIKYKKVESIISELELCLADYEDKFNMNGISYSIFKIGEILSNIKKRSDINGR